MNGGKHLGSESDYDDIEGMIERTGCAKEYYVLEECLAEHDRDWRKCQKVISDLKKCNEKKKQN